MFTSRNFWKAEMAGHGFGLRKFLYRLAKKVSPLPVVQTAALESVPFPVPQRGAWKRADFALDREPRRGAWKRSDLQLSSIENLSGCAILTAEISERTEFDFDPTSVGALSLLQIQPSHPLLCDFEDPRTTGRTDGLGDSIGVTENFCTGWGSLDVDQEGCLLETVSSLESLLEPLSLVSTIPELSEEEFVALFGQTRLSGSSTPQSSEPMNTVPPIFQDLTASDLENLVARLYRAQGYPAAWVTSPLPNRCVDVVAAREVNGGLETLAIHCVCQKRVIDSTELKKLLDALTPTPVSGLIAHPSYSAGVLVTATTFSPDAFQFAAENTRLQLIDGNRLAKLLVQHRVHVR